MNKLLLGLLAVSLASPAYAQSALYSNSSGIGVGTTSPVAGKGLTIAPSAVSSGTPSLLTITAPADTGLTASTEANDISFDLNRTLTFATGNLTTQRAMYIQAPTYAFAGPSTISNAATVDISGPPIAGSNATITNPAALIVESGNVGIGTTSPSSRLSIVAPASSYSITASDGTVKSALFDGTNGGGFKGASIGTITNDPFYIYTNQSGAQFLVATSGWVGVNTTSPQAPLDVNGFARLALNSSAPATCSASNEGAVALTHLAQVCVCDTTPAWHILNTSTACSW